MFFLLFCSSLFFFFFFFFNDTATTEIYTLSLHDALPISVLEQAGHLAAEVAGEQSHQCCHLGRRAAPVVGGEGEQGEGADAESGRRLHDAAYRLRAGAMAGRAGPAAPRGPAAVAVHHDRDVERRTLRHKVTPQKKFGVSHAGWRGSTPPCGPGSAPARGDPQP